MGGRERERERDGSPSPLLASPFFPSPTRIRHTPSTYRAPRGLAGRRGRGEGGEREEEREGERGFPLSPSFPTRSPFAPPPFRTRLAPFLPPLSLRNLLLHPLQAVGSGALPSFLPSFHTHTRRSTPSNPDTIDRPPSRGNSTAAVSDARSKAAPGVGGGGEREKERKRERGKGREGAKEERGGEREREGEGISEHAFSPRPLPPFLSPLPFPLSPPTLSPLLPLSLALALALSLALSLSPHTRSELQKTCPAPSGLCRKQRHTRCCSTPSLSPG